MLFTCPRICPNTPLTSKQASVKTSRDIQYTFQNKVQIKIIIMMGMVSSPTTYFSHKQHRFSQQSDRLRQQELLLAAEFLQLLQQEFQFLLSPHVAKLNHLYSYQLRMMAKQFRHPLSSDKQFSYSALQLLILQALKSYKPIDSDTVMARSRSRTPLSCIYNKIFQLASLYLLHLPIILSKKYKQNVGNKEDDDAWIRQPLQIPTMLQLQVRQGKTEMFLEQNLFSIYRLILKTPRVIFIAALILAIFVAITQISYISKTRRTVDISESLLEYIIKKNDQRKDMREQIQQVLQIGNASRINSSNSATQNETDINDFTLIDDTTLLHFRFAKIDHFRIDLNYSYNYTTDQLPFMVLIKNQHLSYLKDSTSDYRRRHAITYDLITLPPFEVQRPMFSYYFQDDLQKNEIMLDSMQFSTFLLENRLSFYRMMNNITDGSLEISQLYLNFYYESNVDQICITINFFQFLTFKLLPRLFVKLVFGCGGLLLVFGASVFTGLMIRYSIISAFTLYLSVYDKFMSHNRGWMRLYLILIYKRYQQGRINALKTLFFFITSQIGVALLLAFGAYCILTKLIMTSMPLMVDQYIVFFMKTIFFIQLFHYVMARSRTTLRFFPILSYITSFVFYTICGLKISPFTLMVLNINLTIQIIFFLGFSLIEKSIVQQNEKGLGGAYCPSYSKPRMLFYAGYDINWQKSLPPIWTYFTNWFDYSFFNETQRSLLEKDYQLLYGRMLGFNERQQIPMEEDDEVGDVQLSRQEQLSNEML